MSPGQIHEALIAEDVVDGTDSILARKDVWNEQTEIKEEDDLQLLLDDVLFTSPQLLDDPRSTMDSSGAGPSSAQWSRPEKDESNADTLVSSWTNIWDAYIHSPNDASLATIVDNGKGINPHLTFSKEHCHEMAATMDFLAEVTERPDTEPDSAPPTPNTPRSTRLIMRAAPPSQPLTHPLNKLDTDTPPLPMPADMLAFGYSGNDDDNIYGLDHIDSSIISSSSLWPPPQ